MATCIKDLYFSMGPILEEVGEKLSMLFEKNGKILFLKEDRCKGCYLCIEVCPFKILEPSNQLNVKGVYPPRLKPNSECSFCGMCEISCPDFALFILEEKELKATL